LTNSKTEITGHLLDKGYTAMLRRIAALILLIGFIFVIINILFIGINTEISVFIYAIFCVYYLLVINRKTIILNLKYQIILRIKAINQKKNSKN
jgi:Flp pilus assembly protein TadB